MQELPIQGAFHWIEPHFLSLWHCLGNSCNPVNLNDLLVGVGLTTTLVMAVGAISASRQPPPSPTPTPKTVTTPIEPKLPLTTKSSQKKSCVVVIKSTNLRHPSGRKKTGQVIKAGTKVTFTGKQEGGWIEISSPVSGWLWKSQTKKPVLTGSKSYNPHSAS